MEFELKLNNDNKLDGVQIVRWDCSDDHYKFIEHQYFTDGEWTWGFVIVLYKGDYTTVNFDAKDWGTMTIARNAAEEYTNGWEAVIVKDGILPNCFNAFPETEESLLID